MTPYPWTIAESKSRIPNMGYAITHNREYIGWMVSRQDAVAAGFVPQMVKIAQRLTTFIDQMPADQRVLIDHHYIATIKEMLAQLQTPIEESK